MSPDTDQPVGDVIIQSLIELLLILKVAYSKVKDENQEQDTV